MYGLVITSLDELGGATCDVEYAEYERTCKDRMVEIMEDASERGWEVLNANYWAAWLQEVRNGVVKQKAFLQIVPLRKIRS